MVCIQRLYGLRTTFVWFAYFQRSNLELEVNRFIANSNNKSSHSRRHLPNRQFPVYPATVIVLW